jgi:hypothetical protein
MVKGEPGPGLLAEMLRQALSKGKQAQLTLDSDSMAPLLRQGDRLLLQSVRVEELQIGDIVVIADSSGLLVHRFWAYRDPLRPVELVLRGDSLSYFDRPVPGTNLLGIVVARLRNGRILALDRPPGRQLDRRLRCAARLENRLYPLPRQGQEPIDAGPEPAVPMPSEETLLSRLWRRLLRSYMRTLVALTSLRAEATFDEQ